MVDPVCSNSLPKNIAGQNPEGTEPSLPDEPAEIRYTQLYSAQFENLALVRSFIVNAAQQCGFDEQATCAAELAVDEAFSNIVEHAYGGESQEIIECTCLIDKSGLTISLRDCGKPFDPTTVPDPDLSADLEDRDVGGLGLFFIRQLMDEVSFKFVFDQKTGKQCNVLRMVKYKES